VVSGGAEELDGAEEFAHGDVPVRGIVVAGVPYSAVIPAQAGIQDSLYFCSTHSGAMIWGGGATFPGVLGTRHPGYCLSHLWCGFMKDIGCRVWNMEEGAGVAGIFGI